MKQHERNLDIQLCACSLLLRILGQGGHCAGCVRCSLWHRPGRVSETSTGPRCPSLAVWVGRVPPLRPSTPSCNKHV